MFTSKNHNLYADIYFNYDYYIIVTISGCYIHFIDFRNEYKILNDNVANNDLGYYAKIALAKSEKLDENSEYFNQLYNDKTSYPKWTKKIIKEYGYKNKTSLFKNMKLCGLSVIEGEIIIRPQNHLRMDHWVGQGIPDSAIITLNADCSDELLGASIKEGFTRCISRRV
ncbi:contact-dependent growth inhibition system immunity protein [Proteus myxofaciens]|uniref:DUF1436 family protein n=1 Tax=Proteus myxofaciens ATCC 19692 TaxID=1354337 RepID=A0A198FHL1_9GAMM|nr:contact-dependent growth inhibition system immunity protein [Proteus myxofaciens]OAT24260.1 hypothetical protein M983_2647 [Proteus myxofaciens ATCC 19692]